MNTTSFEASGGDAFERIKRALDAADIDPSHIEEISIDIVHHPDSPSAAEPIGDVGLPEEPEEPEEPEAEPPEEPEVEYGPTEPDPDIVGRQGGPSGGNYRGALPPNFFEGEALRPDSLQGKVLAFLDDHPDEWFRRDEAAEELDGVTTQQAGDALVSLYNQHGWVKRRKANLPNRRGVQREYAITESGHGAIAEGRRRAEKYAERQRQQQEEEMEDG